MKPLRCPFCAGTLVNNDEKGCYICEYCGTPISSGASSDEKIHSIRERADKLFLDCDFDAASSLYQSIITEDPNDAEVFWLLALCTYGIQYVDDPLTGKRIPTCHRTIYTSILHNDDYLNALDCCADPLTKEAYEKAATRIDQIQKSILQIVEQETPYDIFICYKETDGHGHRTKESDISKDLYYKLTNQGYRTFYAPITLQEKAGREYEPFIFAALNTARIMITIGFSADHFNAVWVKNEWSRFLARKARNPRLMLICCYNSFLMDASDIPEELSKTQARDLANASTNDLVADIQKLLPKKESAPEKAVSAVSLDNLMSTNATALLRRGYIYLEDGEFREAIESFNKSLDMNPEISKGYWGLLLAKSKCRNSDDLASLGSPITETNEYRKAIRFASESEQDEYQDVIASIDNKINNTLNSLYAARRNKINVLGVSASLNSAETFLAESNKSFNTLASTLTTLEKDIISCLTLCTKELAPFEEQIQAQVKAVNTIKNTYANQACISNENTSQLLNNINESTRLAREAKSNAANVIANSANFKKLRELRQQHADTIQSLIKLNEKVDEYHEILDDKYDKMVDLENLYQPALDDVPHGKYNKAKHLLSQT